MDLAALDEMNTEQLREEVERLMIPVMETRKNSSLRDRLSEAIVTHYEKNAPNTGLLSFNLDPPTENRSVSAKQAEIEPLRTSTPGFQQQQQQQSVRMSRPGAPVPLEVYLSQFCNSFATQMRQQQQQLLKRLILAVDRNSASSASSANSVVPPSSAHMTIDPSTTSQVNAHSNAQSRSVFGLVSLAHAVSLLTSQIPEYGGGDEEDIQRGCNVWTRWHEYTRLQMTSYC